MGNGPDINCTFDLSCVNLKSQSKGNYLTFSLLSWAQTLFSLQCTDHSLVSKLNRSAVFKQ